MPANNRKIAHNTIMLYARMLLTMIVSLYTSRIILDVLGVDDFGIYNLVAGFITLFSFISRALLNAIQRFINVALGEKDNNYFRRIFSTSINIFVFLSIIVIIIGETVGVWFVNTQINIAEERQEAAQWVFQFSIFVFILNMIRIPYNAAIIAYEEMGFYAIVSIIEVLLRFCAVFILQYCNYDKLILYSIFLFLTIVLVNIITGVYCKYKFANCKYEFVWDKRLFKELLSFSTWSLIGQSTVIGRTQGENYLINYYHSVAANAAQGVSAQVNGTINGFVANFQTAFNPQLIQTYANGEMKEHTKLLFRACKFSFFLLLIFVVPVIFNLDVILSTWLTIVPKYSREFSIYGLLSYLLLALSSPLATTIYAEGRIRNFQIATTICHIFGFILSFLFLYFGLAPYSVAFAAIVSQVIVLIVRFHFCSKILPFDKPLFVRTVIIPIIVVFLLSMSWPLYFSIYELNIGQTIFVCSVEALWVVVLVYVFGLNKEEKIIVNQTIENVLFIIRKNVKQLL